MNTRTIRICLIREGLTKAETFIMDYYTVGVVERVKPTYNEDLQLFNHIAGLGITFMERSAFEEDYAKMFLFHGFNVLALDENFNTIFLYKKDGTIKSN